MKSSVREMTIGELAGRFGLATHVLRHWEAAGVLTPARRVGDRRRYGPEQVSRVALILLAKEVGFGLEQIRQILSAPDRKTRDRHIEEHRRALERRIAQATTAKEMLEHALECPHETFDDCPVLQRELAERIP